MAHREISMLLHVASQIMYRWTPPWHDLGDLVEDSHLPDLDETRVDDWFDFLCWLRNHSDKARIWLEHYERVTRDEGGKLVAALTRHLTAVARAKAKYVVWSDSEYPEALRHLPDPPLGLTMTGNTGLLQLPMISVVGSRKASALAVHQSFAAGTALASRGVVVVSGGAFGCDIAAHQGVLAAGRDPAPAVCVFAGGLGKLYPRTNLNVFSRVSRLGGVMLSERLWDAPCRPVDFMARNRIISGLSRVTVVMQAAKRSGALVTARKALDQGADVLVLKHPDGDIRAVGSDTLLADGAPSFLDVEDLVRQLSDYGHLGS